MKKRPAKKSAIAIFSDMDGTMFDDQLTAPTKTSKKALKQLQNHLDKREIPLVYITGRTLELVEEAIETHNLPHPTVIAANVGSEIYRYGDEGWEQCDIWAERMRSEWSPATAKKLGNIVLQIPGAELQPEEFQSEFKRSYYVEPNKTSVNEVRNILSQEDLLQNSTGVKAVVSGPGCIDGSGSPRRIFIDFLPSNGSKANAATFIARDLRIPMDDVFYADDSANGLDALNAVGKPVLVGTDEPDIIDMVDENVYVSSHPHIFGVIDGLIYHGIMPKLKIAQHDKASQQTGTHLHTADKSCDVS